MYQISEAACHVYEWMLESLIQMKRLHNLVRDIHLCKMCERLLSSSVQV